MLNNLYVNGQISIASINIDNDNAFFINILSRNIISIKYTIPIMIVAILYIILFFLRISGLFIVSAGANSINVNSDKHAIVIKIYRGIFIYLHNNGIPINVGTELIQHIHDLEACIPKPVVLSKLNSNRTIIVSLNIFRRTDINNITINLVIERYMDSKPYLILSICSLS